MLRGIARALGFRTAPVERRALDRRIADRRVGVEARRAPRRIGRLGLAGTALLLFAACGKPNNDNPVTPPVSGDDGGLRDAISDSEVTELVGDVTGASVGQIFILPALEGLLKRGIAAEITFDLPAELRGRNFKISDKFVLHMPSIRIPGNGSRSRMEDVFTVGRDPKISDDGLGLTLGITPKQKSFDDDRAEGEGDSRYTPWRLVLELNNDGEVIYVVREVRVKGGVVRHDDAGTDVRRDDAGRDVPPPPPPTDAGTGDARRRPVLDPNP